MFLEGGGCQSGYRGSVQALWVDDRRLVPGGKFKRVSQSIDMCPVARQRLHLIVGHLRREWPS